MARKPKTSAAVPPDAPPLPAVYAAGAMIAFGAALLLPRLLDYVALLGHNIPSLDLRTDYLQGAVWAVALGVLLALLPFPTRHKRDLLILWGVKIVVALGLMLFYESFYDTLDAYGYFNVPPEYLGRNGFILGDGTNNIFALGSLNNNVFPMSYHLMKVSYAMLGLMGIYLFYRASILATRRENRRLLYALALFPTVLFWSSIIGKDPIVLFGVGLYVCGVIGWYQKNRAGYLLFVAAGIGVGVFIRLWLGPVLALPAIILISLTTRSAVMRIGVFALSLGLFAVVFVKFQQFINISLVFDLLTAGDGSVSGAASAAAVIPRSPLGLALFLPFGAFTALFRPVLGEIRNPFGILAGTENLVTLLLLIRALRRADKATWRHPLVLWAVSIVVLWSCFYAFISIQNLGGAARFRLQIFPVLLLLLFYLGQKRGANRIEIAPRDF